MGSCMLGNLCKGFVSETLPTCNVQWVNKTLQTLGTKRITTYGESVQPLKSVKLMH